MLSLTFVTRIRPLLVIAIAVLTLASRAQAEVDPSLTADPATEASVRLTDGSVIMGAVIDIREDSLHLKTAFSDNLAIDVNLVTSLQWLQETELLLDDDRIVVVPALKVDEGKVDLGEENLALADIDIMNPVDWETGIGYQWTGDTGAAIAYNRGNTRTDELDVNINTVFTSIRDRYTFNANFEQDDAYNLTEVEVGGELVQRWDKQATADNWKVLGKYDYFIEGSGNYVGANASVEADALAGIDLRTYIGPYFGRHLIEREELTLDGELGLAAVSTDYEESLGEEDNEYVGLNWNFTGESNILGGDSRLYLRHVGIMDVEDASQLILKTTAGLAFPLLYGLEGAAEITIDYDGTAAEDREEVDEVYKFRVGYAW